MAESVTRSLAKAEAIAKARGAALTPIRRRVLEALKLVEMADYADRPAPALPKPIPATVSTEAIDQAAAVDRGQRAQRPIGSQTAVERPPTWSCSPRVFVRATSLLARPDS